MDVNDMWFQQDGGTSHTANDTMNILHERFEGMVILAENLNSCSSEEIQKSGDEESAVERCTKKKPSHKGHSWYTSIVTAQAAGTPSPKGHEHASLYFGLI
ncbi:hypothetical protein J6590_073427 [Homalodisca vitripennis]|nr:hypothetical protein J6590_073427 [Homalodisca vitripennis]